MIDTALARLPTSNKEDNKNKQSHINKQKVIARFKQLIERRQPWMNRWKAIRNYQLPYIGAFDDENDHIEPARRKDLKINSGVAWESAQIFAAGVMSGLTPPSRQWFKFTFSNQALADNIEAAAILDERQAVVMQVLSSSNFYNSIHSVYTELPFGQCPMAIFPHAKKGVHFVTFSIGSYMLDVGADGLINTFARKYKMTAAQLEEQFGSENLPQNVKETLLNNNKYSTLFTVCCLFEENTDRKTDNISRVHLPYRALYWLEDSPTHEFLHIGGCHEFPVKVARYLVTGLDAYAKGPGWFAEADSKMLQYLRRDYLTASQLAINPAMQADQNTANRGVNLIPGACNIVDNPNSFIKPVHEVRYDFTGIGNEIMETKNSIKRAYSADLFLMLGSIDKGQMTAREVMERNQEKLQQLGPVVERLQFEFLNPVIERVYSILERANMLPQFPPEILEQLQGEEVKIEYISPLAIAQKMSGLINIEQAVAFTASFSQLCPEVVDLLNPVETIKSYYEALGAPAVMRRSDEEFAKIQKSKQEAIQEEKQAAMIAAAAKPAADYTQAAKNMSEAVGGGNSAMANWLGMPNMAGGA